MLLSCFSQLALPSGILWWMVCLIVFLILELVTVNLVTIWFAAGALCSIIVALLGGGCMLQVVIFFLVSAVLIAATRPFARRIINANTVETNTDALIGQNIIIKERVDNHAHTGSAFADGKEWTVRTLEDDVVIESGSTVTVIAISGVKLIVELPDTIGHGTSPADNQGQDL